MKNNIRYKGNTNNTSVIIFLIGGCPNKNSQGWYFAWENLQWGFCCCCSFIFVLHFVVIFVLHFVVAVLHFISRVLCHVTGTPPWFLRPVNASTSSELYPDYFWLPLLFHLPRALRFWVSVFYPQAFFTLRSFTDIFDSTCVYQDLPGSRQFFLEVCRASYWSSKHRPGPSVCLIHSNPLSSYSEEFIFKFCHVLSWITCGKKISLYAPYSFRTLFACSKSYLTKNA